MIDALLKYYGVDWLNFLLVLVHIELLVHKKRSAFVWGFLASVVGVIFAFMIQSWGNGVMCATFMFFHVRAWIKWREIPMSRD